MRTRGQRISRKQENQVAEDFGGHVQKASGATDFHKGDVRVGKQILFECKATEALSYSLKLPIIAKIQMEAARGGYADWALIVDFRPPASRPRQVAVIDYQTYLDMMERLNALEEK